MRQNAFGGRAVPGPAGGAWALPQPLAAIGGGVPTSTPIAARGSGGALKLPQRVLAEPGRQTHCDAFRPKFAPFWVSNAALFF